MDDTVDSLNKSYEEFVAAAVNVLEANENSGGQKTEATNAALENFKHRWELFKAACDQAQEFVEFLKHSVLSGGFANHETADSGAEKSGQAITTSQQSDGEEVQSEQSQQTK